MLLANVDITVINNWLGLLKAIAEVMKGKYDKANAVDPNFLNYVTWYSATDWKRPYPEKASYSCRVPSLKPPGDDCLQRPSIP